MNKQELKQLVEKFIEAQKVASDELVRVGLGFGMAMAAESAGGRLPFSRDLTTCFTKAGEAMIDSLYVQDAALNLMLAELSKEDTSVIDNNSAVGHTAD